MLKQLTLIVALLMSQCGSDDCDPPQMPECQGIDSRMVGTWLLVSQCECYTLGGDMKWKKPSLYRSLTFDSECNVTIEDSSLADCKKGFAGFTKDNLELILQCSNCGISPNEYDYEFDADTLILKGYVEEGFFGSKYLKQ